MPLYTFYPTLESGLAESFATADLESDADVARQALTLLNEHRSAACVVVYCGDRKVHTRMRADQKSPPGDLGHSGVGHSGVGLAVAGEVAG